MATRVYIAALFDIRPSLERAWLAALPPARQAAIGGWPERRDRHRSLLASRLLAEGLARLGHPPTALQTLQYAAGQRPTLDLPLHFSIAHGGDRVACAVAPGWPVGIDVEALGGLTAAAFPHYLGSAERAWAGASPRRFYRLWTAKEAVAKAAGGFGLAALPDVAAWPDRGRAAGGGAVWRVLPLAVGPGHVAHLALPEAVPGEVRCERLVFSDDGTVVGCTAFALRAGLEPGAADDRALAGDRGAAVPPTR